MSPLILTAPILLATTSMAMPAPQGGGPAPGARRGIVADYPAVAVISGSGSTDLRLKPEGDQHSGSTTTLPPLWSAASPPNTAIDYSLSSVLSGTGLVIDAISSGNGAIPAPEEDGSIPLNNGRWLGITVSVANGSDGNAGSLIHDAHSLGHSTGGEVVTYYLEDSQGIASLLPNTTVLETNRADFGLQATSAEDITALDYGMGIHSYNFDAEQWSAFFRNKDRVYFSVTQSSAASSTVVDFAKRHGSGWKSPNGSDIYMVEWDGNDWGEVKLWATADLLGLDEALSDVDALEVSIHTRTVVYSAHSDSQYLSTISETSQLMVTQMSPYAGTEYHMQGNNVDPTPLVEVDANSNTDKVTNRLGIGDDGGQDEEEVDAVCGIDPESQTFGPLLAVPVGYYAAAGAPMGLSMCRGEFGTGANSQRLIVRVSGWGDAIPQEGTVQLLGRAGGGLWQQLAVTTRTRTEQDVAFDLVVNQSTPTQTPTTRGMVAMFFDLQGTRRAISLIGTYHD